MFARVGMGRVSTEKQVGLADVVGSGAAITQNLAQPAGLKRALGFVELAESETRNHGQRGSSRSA